jgi:RPA family protein
MMTTQKQVRAAFWQGWQGRQRPKRMKDGDYPTYIRVEFVDFVDMLVRNGHISEALAQRVTL